MLQLVLLIGNYVITCWEAHCIAALWQPAHTRWIPAAAVCGAAYGVLWCLLDNGHPQVVGSLAWPAIGALQGLAIAGSGRAGLQR